MKEITKDTVVNYENLETYLIENFEFDMLGEWCAKHYSDRRNDKEWIADQISFSEAVHGEYPEIFKVIEQEGGGEGGAENCHSVIEVQFGEWTGKLIKVFYNYYSHHGYDFDYAEAREVAPVQRMVTFYE